MCLIIFQHQDLPREIKLNKKKIWNDRRQGCQLQLRQLIKTSMNSFTRELRRRSGVTGVAHIKQLLIQLRYCRGQRSNPSTTQQTYLELGSHSASQWANKSMLFLHAARGGITLFLPTPNCVFPSTPRQYHGEHNQPQNRNTAHSHSCISSWMRS